MPKKQKQPKEKICVWCLQPIKGYPALSRVDNKTEICSTCGTREALMQWFAYNDSKKNK